MPCGVENRKLISYVLFSLCLQHRLDSLKPRDLLEPDPKKWFPVCQAIWTLQCHHGDGIPQKSSFFSLWIFRLIILPFSFHFLKFRVGLWKVVKQHTKCEMSILTLNFPRSEHQMKTSLGFIVAFWLWQSTEEGAWKLLYTVNDYLPVSCLKYHDYLWKVSLIKLDTVWLGKKKKKFLKLATNLLQKILDVAWNTKIRLWVNAEAQVDITSL